MRHKQVLGDFKMGASEWVNWQTFQGFRIGQHLKEIAPLFLQIVGQARAPKDAAA